MSFVSNAVDLYEYFRLVRGVLLSISPTHPQRNRRRLRKVWPHQRQVRQGAGEFATEVAAAAAKVHVSDPEATVSLQKFQTILTHSHCTQETQNPQQCKCHQTTLILSVFTDEGVDKYSDLNDISNTGPTTFFL